MRLPISLIFLFIAFSSYTQCRLEVEAYMNTTGKHDNNVWVDSIHVKIINLATNEESSFDFIDKEVENCYLKVGNFQLICTFKGQNEPIIVDIRAYSDQITFVSLLLEPESELSRKQRKIRRKKFTNMKDL